MRLLASLADKITIPSKRAAVIGALNPRHWRNVVFINFLHGCWDALF